MAQLSPDLSRLTRYSYLYIDNEGSLDIAEVYGIDRQDLPGDVMDRVGWIYGHPGYEFLQDKLFNNLYEISFVIIRDDRVIPGKGSTDLLYKEKRSSKTEQGEERSQHIYTLKEPGMKLKIGDLVWIGIQNGRYKAEFTVISEDGECSDAKLVKAINR